MEGKIKFYKIIKAVDKVNVIHYTTKQELEDTHWNY